MKQSKSVMQVIKVYKEYAETPAKAERELKKMIRQGQETGDPVMIGTAYLHIGLLYADLIDEEGMFTNSYKAVAFLQDTDEYDMLVRSYVLLGYSYEQQEYFKTQLDLYERANKLTRKHRLGLNNYIPILNNLATCYHHMGDCKSAIRVQEECIRLHNEHAPEEYARVMMYAINLAEYHTDNGDPKKALDTLEPVKKLVGKVDFKPYICDFFLRLAIVSLHLEDPESAYQYIEKSFTYMEEDVYLHQVYDDLRVVSHHLIRYGEKKISRRIYELMKSYAEKRPGIAEQIIAYRTMAEYHAGSGSDRLAVECYEKLEELNEKRRADLDRIQLSMHKREISTANEIQKLKKQLSKTEELAFLDPLSQLLNRAALLRVASDFIETALKKKEKIGAIFIDIDYFKQCNDTYGHAKGDEIIRDVARACKKEEKAYVRFARYGGDEFFGITRGLGDKDVIRIARRICERIRKADIPNVLNPKGHRVTLSVGLANVLITDQTDTIIEIANYADKAVYYAKNAGKDCIYFLDHGRKDEQGRDDPFVLVTVESGDQ